MLIHGPDNSLKSPFHWGGGFSTPSNTWFLGPTRVSPLNGISISWTVFDTSMWPSHRWTAARATSRRPHGLEKVLKSINFSMSMSDACVAYIWSADSSFERMSCLLQCLGGQCQGFNAIYNLDHLNRKFFHHLLHADDGGRRLDRRQADCFERILTAVVGQIKALTLSAGQLHCQLQAAQRCCSKAEQ